MRASDPLVTLESVSKTFDNGVKALLAVNGFESSKEIPKLLYEDLCADLQSPQMAAWWNGKGEQPETQAA
jgi:hypothetical protein